MRRIPMRQIVVSRWVVLWLAIVLVAEFVLALPANAAGPIEPKPIPRDLVQVVESARRMGRLLYLYDNDTAEASDAAEQFASGRRDPPVRGWLRPRRRGCDCDFFRGAR